MQNKYENLEKLNDLYTKGVITEEEYKAEKNKLLNRGGTTSSADSDNKYSALMHLSQFLMVRSVPFNARKMMTFKKITIVEKRKTIR